MSRTDPNIELLALTLKAYIATLGSQKSANLKHPDYTDTLQEHYPKVQLQRAKGVADMTKFQEEIAAMVGVGQPPATLN
jgi:hypothetical protein